MRLICFRKERETLVEDLIGAALELTHLNDCSEQQGHSRHGNVKRFIGTLSPFPQKCNFDQAIRGTMLNVELVLTQISSLDNSRKRVLCWPIKPGQDCSKTFKFENLTENERNSPIFTEGSLVRNFEEEVIDQ